MAEQKLLVLRDELQEFWRDIDVFAQVQALDGEVAREVAGRQTLRFELNGQVFYRKLHTGVGWAEIIKNLVRFRLPIIGAANEWHALNRLAELGIPSLIPVAYGEKYRNPAKKLSFIVTRELSGTIELDKYLASQQCLAFAEKMVLIREVAKITRAIHTHGINHRDLYLCHFMLDEQSIVRWRAGGGLPALYLVDLHRAQMRAQVPHRWRVKDLASVCFSGMNLELTTRDFYRFITIYFDQPLGEILRERDAMMKQIQQRALQLLRREQRLKARGLRD